MAGALVHRGQHGAQFRLKGLVAMGAPEAARFLEVAPAHVAMGATFGVGAPRAQSVLLCAPHPEQDFGDRHDALHVHAAFFGAVLAKMELTGLPVDHLRQVDGRLMLLTTFAKHAASRLLDNRRAVR